MIRNCGRRSTKNVGYVQGNFLDDRAPIKRWQQIADSSAGNAVFYLATAPRFFSEVVRRLGASGLLEESPKRSEGW